MDDLPSWAVWIAARPLGSLQGWRSFARRLSPGCFIFNRDTLATMLGLSPALVDVIEKRCWRRLWRPRRVLSRGFLDSVRGTACWPPGPLAGGPARASDRDEPCATGGLRGRDRLPQRRHDPRLARRDVRGPRGVRPHQRVDPASHAGAMLYRALSRAECADHLYRAAHQQDPVRYLSRARPLRGLVLLRTDHRAGGARPGDRQHRDEAAQPDRRR